MGLILGVQRPGRVAWAAGRSRGAEWAPAGIPGVRTRRVTTEMRIPGFGGQGFMPAAIEKIKTAKAYIREKKLKCEIIVDGGINLETGKLCVDAGADILVSGSFIMKSNDAKGLVEKLQKLK